MSEEFVKNILRYNAIKDYHINEDLSVDVIGNVNLQKQNLKNIPIKFNVVSGNFIISDNMLITLEGCPNEVKGSFDCARNKLTSLKGAPKKVGYNFDFQKNLIRSLKYIPEEIGEMIIGYHNPIKVIDFLPNTGTNFYLGTQGILIEEFKNLYQKDMFDKDYLIISLDTIKKQREIMKFQNKLEGQLEKKGISKRTKI